VAVKKLRNTTVSDIFISDVGPTIAASSTYTIPPQDYLLWAASTDIDAFITSGDIVVVDDVGDLSADRGKDFLDHPDTAFNVRFLSETERSNSFASKNVQEAIEEARDSAGSVVLIDVPCLASVSIADVVRMVSGTATEALATSIVGANFIGIAIAKSTSVLCNIQIVGVTPAIFSGLDDTKISFLSDVTAGAITDVPITTASNVLIRVGNPFSATRLNVDKGIRIIRS